MPSEQKGTRTAWARRTVVDRNFYVGLSGEVPDAVCGSGPYRYVRHPFYLSYMLAFLGVAVGFPSLIISGVCLLNIELFAYMAFDDERVLLQSPLAADYKSYKLPVGMFLPRFAAKRDTGTSK
jgi:protein-S-isoprenylcysteine O-methyltransferase Ste14